MPGSEKKSPVLSDKMIELKFNIQDKIRKEEELQEAVHKKSRFVDTISNGIANIFGLIASIPTAVAELPVVGFAIKMFAVIPGAITTLTDSKKSIAERAIAIGILAAVVALSIAGVAVVAAAAGATAALIKIAAMNAAIIGTTVASFMAAMEIFKLVTLCIEKYYAKTALNDKAEFEEALRKEEMPGDKFDDQLEIRAVELERKKSRPGLTSDEQQEIEGKLKFVKSELSNRSITIAENKEGSAYKLQELYTKRDQKLLEMATLINKIQSATEGTDLADTFEKMRVLQEEVVTIDNDIEEITQPLEKVTRRNLLANENIAQCVTTLSMALVGVILSVAGYLVAAGTFASIVGPVLSGFGIGMASLSLVTAMAFKYAEHEDIKAEEAKQENHKDSILDEALYCYDNQVTKSSGLSTSIIMSGLGSKANMEPAVTGCAPKIASKPEPTPVVPVKTIEPSVAVVEKQPEETVVNSSSLSF